MDGYELPAQCFANGTVNFFGASNCLGGVTESITLTKNASTFVTSTAGTISGKMLTIRGGIKGTGWVTNVATNTFALPTTTPVEIIGLVSYILALVGHSISIWWSGKRQYEKKSRQRLFLFVSQFLWFGEVVAEMVMVCFDIRLPSTT